MTPMITIERTKEALDERFSRFIDLSDLKATASPEEKRASQLSRGLAALAIMALTEADPTEAVASITDGYDDLGVDAIYFEPVDSSLYVFQSKWSESGTKTIELGECLKFIEGMYAVIRANFSKGNERLRKREQEVRGIMRRSDVRIVLVIVHSGGPKLGDPISEALQNFLKKQNNVGEEVVALEIFDLARIYAHLSPEAGRKINLRIGLSHWGIMRDPFLAYYGQVKVSDVASWSGYGRSLLDRNLRFYRGSTDVNNAMDDTIANTPEKFWYFNNGVTVLCTALDKTRLNGDDTTWGVFDCEGVSIVNGAQTVGVIWERQKQRPGFFDNSTAQVHLRIISLEKCPEGFGAEVTRATNTQNEIKHRDFSALDETQQNIAREMSLEGRRYAFKSGDPDPEGSEGCTIEEATIALACANGDVSLAVAAKREIGSLWRDITKPPYTTIFNERVRARDVWRAVVMTRAIEAQLQDPAFLKVERGDQILVHGNRFILHSVFQAPEVKRARESEMTEGEALKIAAGATGRVFEEIAAAVNKKHPGAYLQPLFKNAQKCRLLLTDETAYIDEQIDMFPKEE